MLARREKDISALSKTNDRLKDVIGKKRSELKRKVSAVNYLDKKIAKLTCKVETEVGRTAEVEEPRNTLQRDLAEKQQEINDTVDENDWLREMVEEKLITTDNAGRYTVEMKQCVCQLLNHNVPTGQIAPVIEY